MRIRMILCPCGLGDVVTNRTQGQDVAGGRADEPRGPASLRDRLTRRTRDYELPDACDQVRNVGPGRPSS